MGASKAKETEKEKIRKLKTEKTVLKAIGVILFVLAFCYTIYEIYDVNRIEIETRTVQEQTIYETIDMDIFFIRDETYIEGSPSGTVVPLAGDSERVSGNANIAAVFQSADGAAKYLEIQEMKNDIERYDSLTSQATFSSLKVGTLESGIRSDICGFLQSVYSGEMQSALNSSVDFRDKATTLDIITGGTLNLTDRRQALAQQITSIESSLGNYSMVGTGIKTAGFYMSETDGYEKTVDYSKVSLLTPEKVNAVLSAKPSKGCGTLGKLVCSYRWYIAAVVDAKEVMNISPGNIVTINLPNSDVKSISTKVYAKNEDTNGKAAIIFVCSDINSQLLSMRKEKAQLVMKSYKGFIINSSEIRVIKGEDGEKLTGVYTKRGNIVSFRKINGIYSGDNYIISGSTSSGGYVQLYDEIIISGRELRDGAVIYN